MIQIENLSSSYFISSGKLFQKKELKAVENVTLEIPEGKIVGLVGESGCGKSSLGRCVLALQEVTSGSVFYRGVNLTTKNYKELLPLRQKLQMIFQDPYSSLNPRMTIFEIITEGLSLHQKIEKEKKEELAVAILEKVSLKEDILFRYPHEFSGGQRQRIAIARVLILQPEFIVCDEIVSALDVSTQAQIINLLLEYKKQSNLSLLFISHDLGVIRYLSDEIVVMYLGKVVEKASKKRLTENPLHPYTKALFASAFDLKKKYNKQDLLQGEIPGVIDKPKGCYFHTRCPISTAMCKEKEPEWREVENGHYAACHYVG
ncbi:MAG: ABC transporter ATP-binding protein [Spirochaetota bacterium]